MEENLVTQVSPGLEASGAERQQQTGAADFLSLWVKDKCLSLEMM